MIRLHVAIRYASSDVRRASRPTADVSSALLTSPQTQWLNDDKSALCYLPVKAPRTPTPATSNWAETLAHEIAQHAETHNMSLLSVHYAVGLVEAALLAR